MAATYRLEYPEPGFSFENGKRNAALLEAGMKPGKLTSTGTTICGAIFKDGVVVAADTRATAGSIVMDKDCMKVHELAPNMVCCGAGTAADCDKITRMMASQLELLRLDWNRQVQVCTANKMFRDRLFRYQGYISAYLVLAGVDIAGPQLYGIHAHGSSEKVPYTSLGSGMLAAMGVLERGWKPDMEEEEAKKLVGNAIRAGIIQDMGSGGSVNMAVIKANDSIEYIMPYDRVVQSGKRQQVYDFKAGSTVVYDTKLINLDRLHIEDVAMN